MYRLFPSRLSISAVLQNPEIRALYDTRNRVERIFFAHKKRQEGYTINDIELLLHLATTTIQRYLAVPENEIPKVKENARERQHIQQMINKQLMKSEHYMNEVVLLKKYHD
jgi:DNA-binding transcriptional MerR regulator